MFFLVFCLFTCAITACDFIDEQIKRLEDYRSLLTEKLKTPIYLKTIPCENISLKAGDCFPYVPELRNLLIYKGYLSHSSVTDEFLYDEELSNVIKSIQKTHLIEETGQLDQKTCRAINRNLERDFNLIQKNIDRLYALKKKIGDHKTIVVDVAQYQLYALDGNEFEFDMKVIVGKKTRPTPLFQDSITNITLNPSWTIPQNILVQDKIKYFSKNPSRLDELNFEVYSVDGELLQSYEIDWDDVRKNPTYYRFQQLPGKRNTLGNVKFNLRHNKQDIKLHGTNSMHLFKKNNRSLSSGCVRLEQPEKLAKWILKDYKKKVCRYTDIEKGDSCIKAYVESKIKKKNSSSIILERNVPVLFEYFSIWIDDKGIVYRNDPYKIDE